MTRESKGPQLHTFHDPGPPIATPDFKPAASIVDPERYLAEAFAAAGRDYGSHLAVGISLGAGAGH